MKLASQPCLAEAEIPSHRIHVDVAHRGDLVLGEAAEVVQLDDPGLALVEPCEPFKRCIGARLGVVAEHLPRRSRPETPDDLRVGARLNEDEDGSGGR